MRIWIALSGLFALLILCASCQSDTSAKSRETEKKVRTVHVARAAEGKLARTVGVSGTLAAEEEVILSLKVTGRVRDIYVDLGSRVRKGQPLVKLEPADFELRVQQSEAALEQARARLSLQSDDKNSDDPQVNPKDTGVVKQAEAQLEQARLTQDRMVSLWNQGLISRSQYDDAIAAFRVAEARYQDAFDEVSNRQALLYQRKAELEIARKQLSDSVLSSPIDGSVQVRHISPGQFLAVGDPALTIVRVNPLRLKLAVPERESSFVKKGQTVQVSVEGDQNHYYGKVARLSPALTTDNRTLMIEAEIPNEQGFLRPGSFAKAQIVVASETPAVLVPKSAIVTFAGLDKVIVVEKNQTLEKRVRTGRQTKDQVEILEGLKAGETIVVQPGNLVGGETVNPVT